MPELPEVETTRQGILPFVQGKTLESLDYSGKKLRYPLNFNRAELAGQKCIKVTRRAKYLFFHFETMKLMVHLGMSGSLRVEKKQESKKKKHDHLVFNFVGAHKVIYHDPRRFGMVVRANDDWDKKVEKWGVEPLSDDFNDEYLYLCLKRTNRSLKTVIMDQSIVVGVGNIYANEVLYTIKVHPNCPASRVSFEVASWLVQEIKKILSTAIQQGGTTLRDFVSGEGKPGYFKQSLNVYGRAGQPCFACNQVLEKIIIAQRSTVFCPKCQPSVDTSSL